MPQIFNVSQIRQMMAGTPIYGYRPGGGSSRDYHDIDIEENMEDESNIIFSPSLDEMIGQKKINSDSGRDKQVCNELGLTLAMPRLFLKRVLRSDWGLLGLHLGLRLRLHDHLGLHWSPACPQVEKKTRDLRGCCLSSGYR